MTSGIDARFDLAIQMARSAGALLMEFYGKLTTVDLKGSIDLVSDADRASELLLFDAVREAFPSDSILAEEGTNFSGDCEWLWVMDPLDGTTNFVHGFPFFMVSLGLLYQDERVAGVCYGPFYDELFSAKRGSGATYNGDSIHVSATESLSESLVATGFPYNRREILDELLAPVARVITLSHGIRRAGAATYDQCLLAAGRLDGFFEQGLNPWDVAAGTLIIEEAGGRVTRYDGELWDTSSPNILATNGRIHSALIHAVNGD
jgi:myo-inositol-1(or 4)-monophosphatase